MFTKNNKKKLDKKNKTFSENGIFPAVNGETADCGYPSD